MVYIPIKEIILLNTVGFITEYAITLARTDDKFCTGFLVRERIL